MPPQRLPIVNGDDGTWGDILRQFLEKEHYDDGTDNAANGGHKTITIRPGGTGAGTAPLKFSSGGPLSSPEAGAMEFDTDTLYFTITTGTTRKKIAIYDDSSGATGDLYYRDSSGNFVRLGIGSAGQILKAGASTPTWGSINSGFGTNTQTTSYTITGTDTVIFADATGGNVTITIPAAASFPGYRFYVKRVDGSANTVTIARTSPDTIEGSTSSFTIDQQYASIALVSDGSNDAWYIL